MSLSQYTDTFSRRTEANEPLNMGSGPSPSSLGFFLLPSPFAAAASRFSRANLSRPSIDVRGVGGSIGLAGLRNVCCYMVLVNNP